MSRSVVVLLAAVTWILAGAARAETLRLADNLPVGHVLAEATKFWMARVTELTGGSITFQYFPAEQLGKAKDMLQLTKSGVADIGQIAPSYTSDKMPLSAVAELPGGFNSSCEGTKVFFESATKGLLARDEFTPNGVHVLYAVVQPPYQLFTTRQQIKSVANFSGLKIRIAGAAMDATVRRLGGTPIRLGAPELYEAMSRGTIDGMLFPFTGLIPYDLAGVSKFGTLGENFGTNATAWIISDARWKRLPPAAQAAMTQAGQEASLHICAKLDEDLPSDIKLLRSKGVDIQPLPADAHAAVVSATANVAKEWAADLDKRGKPGTEVLDEFQSLVRTGN